MKSGRWLSDEDRAVMEIIVRVALGVVALFSASFACADFFWSDGRSKFWLVPAVVALFFGWHAGRGLPLRRPRQAKVETPKSSDPSPHL
jgi:hypothetical protein